LSDTAHDLSHDDGDARIAADPTSLGLARKRAKAFPSVHLATVRPRANFAASLPKLWLGAVSLAVIGGQIPMQPEVRLGLVLRLVEMVERVSCASFTARKGRST
jgi:hypothetical protein